MRSGPRTWRLSDRSSTAEMPCPAAAAGSGTRCGPRWSRAAGRRSRRVARGCWCPRSSGFIARLRAVTARAPVHGREGEMEVADQARVRRAQLRPELAAEVWIDEGPHLLA